MVLAFQSRCNVLGVVSINSTAPRAYGSSFLGQFLLRVEMICRSAHTVQLEVEETLPSHSGYSIRAREEGYQPPSGRPASPSAAMLRHRT
jgi:hypothetical protein